MEFPAGIKTRVFQIIEQAVTQFGSEQDKKALLENIYVFTDEDEETELIQAIIEFANTAEVKPIADRNIAFCRPSTFNMPSGIVSTRFSIQGSGGDLIDILDDFILYAIRLLSDRGYNEELLEAEWNKFQTDFFQDEVDIVFYTHLSAFYYHSGGIIEDMIPDPNIKVRYLHTRNIQDKVLYYNLRQSIEHSFRPASKEEFLEASAPLLIEFKKRINKTDRLETHFHEANAIFEKVTFIIRIICGGSAHFDFIKPIFFGNHSSRDNLLQNYPSNHLYTNTDPTTMGASAPDQTWVTRLWGGISGRDVFEWQFVNQKTRDSFSRVTRDDAHYYFDKTYQLTRQLEKIVDLIQALENVIGDHGKHNAEYVAKINARGDARIESDVQTKLTALYSLRNKYLHGRPTGNDSVDSEYQSSFHGNIQELDACVKALDYNLRKIVMVSIMNSDLKQNVLDYHRGLRRSYFNTSGMPTRDRHPTAISFPVFNTIYYR